MKQFLAKSPKEWRNWLEENHAKEKEIWLVYYKKHTGIPSISYLESVEVALCFGWIDGNKKRIDDVIVGNAMPEAEQGLNMGRLISLMGLKIEDVPGMTVNRYCASGLETVSIAVAKIQSGMADCIIAGGVESMSYIPMGGYRPVPNYKSAKEGHEDYYWGMGNTAEAVAKQFKVSREDQDEFAFNSHMKALKAQAENRFKDQIAPIDVEQPYLDENGKKANKKYTVTKDESPRAGTRM